MLYEFLFIFWILDDDPYCFENVNYDTLDIANQVDVVEKIKNGDLCQIECQNEDDCNFWSLNNEKQICYLLKEAKEPTINRCTKNCKRGPKECPDKNSELKTYVSPMISLCI